MALAVSYQCRHQLGFDYIGDFNEGLARIVVGKKYGYIDHSGQVVIKPRFDQAWSFHEGLALI